MEILNNYHNVTHHSSEAEMQEQVDLFLKKHKFSKRDVFGWTTIPKLVLREFPIPEIGRISDHVLLLDKKRAINIECKLIAIDHVIAQAISHLEWCDYSIICLPPDVPYVTTKHLLKMINNGLGLFYWFKDIGIFEFILPKFNGKKNEDLRKKVIERILSKE